MSVSSSAKILAWFLYVIYEKSSENSLCSGGIHVRFISAVLIGAVSELNGAQKSLSPSSNDCAS